MSEPLNRPFSAASYYQFIQEKKLMGSRCVRCDQAYLPPRAICPQCHKDQMEWLELNLRGKLVGFTSIYIGPSFMNELGYGRDHPYVSGIVELEQGVRMSARIIEVDARQPETIRIGSALQGTFIKEEADAAQKIIMAFKPEEQVR